VYTNYTVSFFIKLLSFIIIDSNPTVFLTEILCVVLLKQEKLRFILFLFLKKTNQCFNVVNFCHPNQLLISLSSVLYSIANIISLSFRLFHGEFNHHYWFTVTFSLDVNYDLLLWFCYLLWITQEKKFLIND